MKLFIGLFLFIVSTTSAQIILNESFPNNKGGLSGDPITTHETNKRFLNTNLIFNGSGIVRNTQQSLAADYIEASGGFNIELNPGQDLIIDKIINTINQSLTLSFGIRKNTITENGTNLLISYSTNGVNGNYIPLKIKPFPTGTGSTDWYYIHIENIPHNVTSIKFESINNQWRIDDIKLHIPEPLIQLSGNNILILKNNTPNITDHTDFGINTSSYGFTTHQFSITNKGNSPVSINSISTSNTTDFSLNDSSGFDIAPLSEKKFSVTFRPQSIGNKSSQINLYLKNQTTPISTFQVTGKSTLSTICNSTDQVIACQSFENKSIDNWNYSLTQNNNISINGNTAYAQSGKRGNTPLFLDSKSLQINNTYSSIILDAINTIDFTNLTLNFNLGSYSTTAGNGADLDDFVSVYISKDNGASWKHKLQVTGYNNSKWSLTSGHSIATKSYNDNLKIFSPSNGGYKLEEGYSKITVTNLPQTANLRIKLVVNNNKENEIWSIDNVKLRGTKLNTKTWENNSWDNSYSTSNSKIIIKDHYDTKKSGNLNACECIIKPNKTLTISQNNILSLHGKLTIDGDLIVKNTGALLQKNNDIINSGQGHFRIHSSPMKKYDYTYWSSPVNNQIIENFCPNSTYYSFSSINNKWAKASGKMEPAIGYIIRAPKSINYSNGNVSFNGDFHGTPNNGIISQKITTDNSKWNLLGNPYPSAINANAFLYNTNNNSIVNGTIYFWTHSSEISNGNSGHYSSNDYASYNDTGGVAAVNGGPEPNGTIAPGQGFFIEGIHNGTVQFNNDMRIDNKKHQFFKPQAIKSRFWLELINTEGAYKQLLIGYLPGATNAIDRNFDGKTKSTDNLINFYSIVDSLTLSIQGRKLPINKNDLIQLGYSSKIEGTFEIQLAKKEGKLTSLPIILFDKKLNTQHDLTKGNYAFETLRGVFNKRFTISYSKQQALNSSSIRTEQNHEQKIKIISTQNELKLINSSNIKSIRVYNINGVQLTALFEINNQQVNIPIKQTKQPLILSISLKNSTCLNKKIIH